MANSKVADKRIPTMDSAIAAIGTLETLYVKDMRGDTV